MLNVIYHMKPVWLNKKISLRDCAELKTLLKTLRVNTVCQEAHCPNIGECFAKRQATFIILGSICTRGCLFCAVTKGVPLALDPEEPQRITEAVKKLDLTHVVLTSVTRDDLPDGGVSVFVETINKLRELEKKIMIETLIPDFQADEKALSLLVSAGPDIIAHNLETVSRLYAEIRPTGAIYARTLDVLRKLKILAPEISLKSGLMLGLGETNSEILTALDDLRAVGCEFLSIGQYLAPSKSHIPVKEYLAPEKFAQYQNAAYARGFSYVKSAPYVRSSFAAGEYITNIKENANA